MSIGLESGSDRVRQGGSWFSGPQFTRVAYRCHVDPGNRISRLGLRLIRRCT